jgi:hypothetical protein
MQTFILSIFLHLNYHNGSIDKGIANGDDWLGVQELVRYQENYD